MKYDLYLSLPAAIARPYSVLPLLLLTLWLGCEEREEADDEPPIVVITFPADLDTLTGPTTIKAEAVDNVSVADVTFHVDGDSIGHDSRSPYEQPWNTAYYADSGWHTVSALAYDVAGNRSAPDSIQVIVIEDGFARVQLISPTDSAVIRDTDQVELRWYSLAEAIEYEVRVSCLGDVPEVIRYSVSGDTVTTTPVLRQDRHEWQVRARNAVDYWTKWSRARILDVDGPLPPTALNPPYNAVLPHSEPVALSWLSSQYAVAYEVEVAVTSSFAEVVYSTTVNDTTALVPVLPQAWYFWRVRAQNSPGFWGDWNLPSRFHMGIVFKRTYSTSGWDIGYNVVHSSDGGYVLAGRTGSEEEMWVIHIDQLGEMTWDVVLSGKPSGWDGKAAIQPTSDGGYILTGLTIDPVADQARLWLTKLDNYGN
ncbi:MAG: hypothetical protein JSW54_04190, partial [Fidelibacterota bacterium]